MTDKLIKSALDTKTISSFIRRTLDMALSAPGFTAVAAVFGIAVLIIVISQFGVSWLILGFGIAATILLAILYLCFSWLSKIHGKHKSLLAGLLGYSIVIAVSGSVLLLFVSTFFDSPLPLKTLIVAKLGSQQDAKVLLEEKTKNAVVDASKSARKIEKIIISETATKSSINSTKLVDFLNSDSNAGKAGYHFIVDRSGLVYPMEDISTVAYHTPGQNQNSIGIGLEHSTGSEAYSDAQIAGLEKLLVSLAHRLKLDPGVIFSKEEINPDRYKRDITPFIQKIRDEVRRKIGT